MVDALMACNHLAFRQTGATMRVTAPGVEATEVFATKTDSNDYK
jgi:hypothetical protein